MTPTPGPEEFALFERLVRIETMLQTMIASSDNTHSDHETRIRKLERALWIAVGAASVGGGIVGQLLAPLVGH